MTLTAYSDTQTVIYDDGQPIGMVQYEPDGSAYQWTSWRPDLVHEGCWHFSDYHTSSEDALAACGYEGG